MEKNINDLPFQSILKNLKELFDLIIDLKVHTAVISRASSRSPCFFYEHFKQCEKRSMHVVFYVSIIWYFDFPCSHNWISSITLLVRICLELGYCLYYLFKNSINVKKTLWDYAKGSAKTQQFRDTGLYQLDYYKCIVVFHNFNNQVDNEICV